MSDRIRRKFSYQQKLDIISEAAVRGTNMVLREHKLSYSVYARWKQKFSANDNRKESEHMQIIQMLKDLRSENEMLKKIVANQALEIQMKNERLSMGKYSAK